MSAQAFGLAAAGVGAAFAAYAMLKPADPLQAQGGKLQSRISEHAVAAAEVVTEPWSSKGHPMFGREMQQATGRDFTK